MELSFQNSCNLQISSTQNSLMATCNILYNLFPLFIINTLILLQLLLPSDLILILLICHLMNYYGFSKLSGISHCISVISLFSALLLIN